MQHNGKPKSTHKVVLISVVHLCDIVIVPYVNQCSSNSTILKSLGFQKVLEVQQLQMKLWGKAIGGIIFIMNNPIVCLAYCVFPHIYIYIYIYNLKNIWCES
jgi:hypothetical protein